MPPKIFLGESEWSEWFVFQQVYQTENIAQLVEQGASMH